MRKKKNNLNLSIIIMINFILVACTGINVATKNIGYGAVTNPTPEYASGLHFIKGGGIYHKHIVPGPIGFNTDGALKGEGCSHAVLFLISWGDSSIETAKKSGNISKVSSVEYEQFAIFGYVYHRVCTIVIGGADNNSPQPIVESIKEKTPVRKGK